jgi:pre-mRNA-processing factor 6
MESDRRNLAEEWIRRGIDTCPTKGPIWAIAADIEIARGEYSRARSILERGRIRLPTDELLWWKGFLVEKFVEQSSGNSPTRVFLSRALQACPNSGLLWSYAIDHEPAVTRHPKCLDALKRCENDPLVILAVARFFWIEKQQIDKARKWFKNASKIGQRYGQVWSDYLAFEASLGDENFFRIEQVVNEIRSISDPPNIGIEWNVFRKRIDNWRFGEDDILGLIVAFSKERFVEVWDRAFGPSNPKLSLFFNQLASTHL